MNRLLVVCVQALGSTLYCCEGVCHSLSCHRSAAQTISGGLDAGVDAATAFKEAAQCFAAAKGKGRQHAQLQPQVSVVTGVPKSPDLVHLCRWGWMLHARLHSEPCFQHPYQLFSGLSCRQGSNACSLTPVRSSP